MSKNRQIAEAFASEFYPPLNVVSVQRVNNVPKHDCWMVAAYDENTGWGVTAHAYSNKLHAYIETRGDNAKSIGKLMAKWLTEAKGDGPKA